jgi:hypothetical protein
VITRELVSLELLGDAFSPAEAQRRTGLPLARSVEPGAIGERGRYKGLPTPHGAAALEPPEGLAPERRLTWVLDAASPHMAALRELGVTEAYVSVGYFWRDQCNLAYSPEELERLSRLGVALWVSCYEEEREPAVAG